MTSRATKKACPIRTRKEHGILTCLMGSQRIQKMMHVSKNQAHVLNSSSILGGSFYEYICKLQKLETKLPIEWPQLFFVVCINHEKKTLSFSQQPGLDSF